jgi:hypothetical protein
MVKVNEIEHRVTGVLRKSGQTLGFNMDEIIFVPTRTALRIFNDEKLFGIRTKARTKVSLDDAVEEVRDIAKIGEKMPHKSTYFYPKLLSGLVINKIGCPGRISTHHDH